MNTGSMHVQREYKTGKGHGAALMAKRWDPPLGEASPDATGTEPGEARRLSAANGAGRPSVDARIQQLTPLNPL